MCKWKIRNVKMYFGMKFVGQQLMAHNCIAVLKLLKFISQPFVEFIRNSNALGHRTKCNTIVEIWKNNQYANVGEEMISVVTVSILAPNVGYSFSWPYFFGKDNQIFNNNTHTQKQSVLVLLTEFALFDKMILWFHFLPVNSFFVSSHRT